MIIYHLFEQRQLKKINERTSQGFERFSKSWFVHLNVRLLCSGIFLHGMSRARLKAIEEIILTQYIPCMRSAQLFLRKICHTVQQICEISFHFRGAGRKVFIWDFPVKPSLSVDKQLGFSPSLQYPKLSSVGVVGVTPVTKHLLDFSGYLSGWFNSYSQNQAACSGVLWGKRSLPIHRSWECVSTWSSHSGRSVNPWYFQFLPFTKQTWPHDWFFSICLYFFLSRRLCSKGEKSNSIMS